MATTTPSSLEIAQEAKLRPITEIAAAAGLEPDELDLYGTYKAKVSLSVLDRLAGRADAKLVCVTAITPTKFGEGKTTTSVSVTQGLGAIGRSCASWAISREEGVFVATPGLLVVFYRYGRIGRGQAPAYE